MQMFCASLYLQRLERQTRNMDQAQYTEFCESRQLSFGEIWIILIVGCALCTYTRLFALVLAFLYDLHMVIILKYFS